MAKLIFGCGYLGQRVGQLWLDAGEQVYAVTRSVDRARTLAAAGFDPLIGDVTQRTSLDDLPEADTVLYAIGLDRKAGKSLHEVYVDGLSLALARLPAETGRIIYISSTGVYGQGDGQWVDEDSRCLPEREGGKACLAAEELLAAHPRGAQRIILRLAGIYGPNRIPHAPLLMRGEPIPAPAEGYLNLIHVDDAAQIVLAVEAQAAPPALYCVSDGQPPVRGEYYSELARLLAAPPPTFTDPPADSPAARRAASDKRVSNARLVREIGPQFRYPTYREGLAAIIAAY